jgi:hypothetical protein
MKPNDNIRNTAMKTQLIAFTTAAAIALTSLGSAPAQASPEDNLVKFLVGAAIIGTIVNEVNKNKQPVVNKHRHQYKPKPKQPRRYQAHYQQKPRKCLRQRMTNNGWKTFYAKRCMINKGWERHNGRGWHTHW